MTGPTGPTGPVHFIWLGGQWFPQYERAIDTAHVHGDMVTLWTRRVGSKPPITRPWLRIVRFQVENWLRDHPIKLANVKDYFMWNLLYQHGGIYLDLDTISLRPAWDLLTADVCCSREYHLNDPHGDPFNSAVVLGRKGAPVLRALHFASGELLKNEVSRWGAIGPRLLTGAVEAYPDEIHPAPFRALNGWSYHAIDQYYVDPRDPGDDVRVIHLYSSDNMDAFLTDRWTPLT